MRIFMIVTISFIFPMYVLASNSYLCIVESAAGFKYENGKWDSTRFDLEEEKYILRRTDVNDFLGNKKFANKYKWLVTHFKSGQQFALCSDFISTGTMICNEGFGKYFKFTVNKKTKRFITTKTDNFLEDKDGSASPYMSIGTCSPLN